MRNETLSSSLKRFGELEVLFAFMARAMALVVECCFVRRWDSRAKHSSFHLSVGTSVRNIVFLFDVCKLL